MRYRGSRVRLQVEAIKGRIERPQSEGIREDHVCICSEEVKGSNPRPVFGIFFMRMALSEDIEPLY